jgi:gliding motility-associated-like protein
METPSFIGLLSYPVICGKSRYFGLMADNMGSTKLFELDMDNKTVIGQVGTLPLDILDGASGTENGLDNKVAMTGLTINKSCQLSSASIKATAAFPGIGDISYTLDNSITNTTGLFNDVPSGQHTIKVAAPGGVCTTDTTFVVTGTFSLVTSIVKTNPDKCADIPGHISIHGSATNGAVSYTLLNTGLTQTTGEFNDLRGGLYRFRISNTSGCSVDTSVALAENIPIAGCSSIFIPNAFTPNFDGKNDQFTVSLPTSYKNISLQIFDRWGNIVCQARGNNISWDGNYKGMPQPVGVYVFSLVYTNVNGEQKVLKGSLSLLR